MVDRRPRRRRGLREWFESIRTTCTKAAAFDTRLDFPVAITGRASKGIAELRQHGATVIAEPQSFFVTKQNRLEPHEAGSRAGMGHAARSGPPETRAACDAPLQESARGAGGRV